MNLFFTEQKNIRSGATIKQIEYFETSQFTKDLKKLLKKLRTLKDDLENLKKNQIELLHVYKIDNYGTFEIKSFSNPEFVIYKVKKFACMSLKRRGCDSGLRLIYAINKIENSVFLLEIYFKGDKENEDISRITDFLKIDYLKLEDIS
jgi:mRNA-degrading endonuclease RelE of RelBE toxin-antitoxin system